MYNIIKVIIIILLIILIAISIANLYRQKQDIEVIKNYYKENQKHIEIINKDIIDIKIKITKSLSYIDSLKLTNKKIIKNYENEISKINKLFKNNNDTMLVNAVLRYWTNRIYNLPEFFQRTASDK